MLFASDFQPCCSFNRVHIRDCRMEIRPVVCAVPSQSPTPFFVPTHAVTHYRSKGMKISSATLHSSPRLGRPSIVWRLQGLTLPPVVGSSCTTKARAPLTPAGPVEGRPQTRYINQEAYEGARVPMSNINRMSNAHLPLSDARHPTRSSGSSSSSASSSSRRVVAEAVRGRKSVRRQRFLEETKTQRTEVSGTAGSGREESVSTNFRRTRGSTNYKNPTGEKVEASAGAGAGDGVAGGGPIVRPPNRRRQKNKQKSMRPNKNLKLQLTPEQRSQILSEMREPGKLGRYVRNRWRKFRKIVKNYEKSRGPKAMGTSWYRKLVQNKRPPNIHDPPVVRRPGDIVHMPYLLQNWWSCPAVGFNSILQIPIHKFEVWEDELDAGEGSDGASALAGEKTCSTDSSSNGGELHLQRRDNKKTSRTRSIININYTKQNGNIGAGRQEQKESEVQPFTSSPTSASIVAHNHMIANTGIVVSRDLKSVLGEIVVPNDVFGVPLRKDLIHWAYWWYRHALAGYDNQTQYWKYDWPASNRKLRSQIRSGMARMSTRCAHTSWEGSFAHPIRPRDWRQRCNRRMLWVATKSMLSAKFAQGEIIVVNDFNISSHKTKHVVQFFRRLVGDRCNSAMCCHEGTRDVNDAFRWATAHIAAIRRCNVEGVDVYKLLKYRYLIISELGLQNLIYKLQTYPKLRKWGPKYATPDGKKCTFKPEKVPGWNTAWKERKERLRNSEFRAKLYAVERKKWRWSTRLEGALKVKAECPLFRFRLKHFAQLYRSKPWEKLEDIYLDDEPLEDEFEEEEKDDAYGMVDGESLRDAVHGNLDRGSETANRRAPLMIRSKEAVAEIGGSRLYADGGAGATGVTEEMSGGWLHVGSGRAGTGSSDENRDREKRQEGLLLRSSDVSIPATTKGLRTERDSPAAPVSVWRPGASYDAFKSGVAGDSNRRPRTKPFLSSHTENENVDVSAAPATRAEEEVDSNDGGDADEDAEEDPDWEDDDDFGDEEDDDDEADEDKNL